MLSLKELPAQPAAEQAGKASPPARLLEWWKTSLQLPRFMPRARNRPVLGLDIGSSLIKAVVLSRSQDRLQLKHVAVAAMPPAALTNGVLTDAIVVSHHLRALFESYRIRTRHVAVALGGEKVYCQTEFFPNEGEGELETRVQRTAEAVLPYPLKSASLDYQEINGESSGGRRSVLWVSSGAEQVDWLRQAVALAGKAPVVADVEACALANALQYGGELPTEGASVVLHIGARCMTVLLLKGPLPIFSRSMVMAEPRRISESDDLPQRVLRRLDEQWEMLNERARPLSLQRIYLSGGRARSPEVGEAVHQRTGLRVKELDPFRRIGYTASSDSGKIVREHGPALAVAVGLALRGFEDL